VFGLLPSDVLAGQRRDWERIEEMILWTIQSPQDWAQLEGRCLMLCVFSSGCRFPGIGGTSASPK
jgi:hypothetical protein